MNYTNFTDKKWTELSFTELVIIVVFILIIVVAMLSIKFFGVWLLFELLKRFNIIESYSFFELLWAFLALYLMIFSFKPKNKN